MTSITAPAPSSIGVDHGAHGALAHREVDHAGDLVRDGLHVRVRGRERLEPLLDLVEQPSDRGVARDDLAVRWMPGVGEVLGARRERAGHDRRRLDPERGDLVGRDRGQAVHGGLRRDVRAEERRRNLRRRAADPQQQPCARLAHVREHRAVDALRAERVDVEHASDLLGRDRLGRADREVAGVVDRHVERGLLGQHRRDGRVA